MQAIYGHPWQLQSWPFMALMKEDQERVVVRKVCIRLADERKGRGISQQRLSEMAD